MKKVQINKEQKEFVDNFKKIKDANLMLFLREMTVGGFVEFDNYTDDEKALIWMGHYEVEQEPLDVIKTHLRTCIEQGEQNEYHNGYVDALQYVVRVIESRKKTK